MSLRIPWPVFFLILGLEAGGCSPAAPTPAPPNTRLFARQAMPVTCEIPVSWVVDPDDDAVVISGPPETDSFFTTIVIQAETADDPIVDIGLEQLYAPLIDTPSFAWELQEPAVAAGATAAIRYAFRVELNESTFLKQGLFMATRNLWIDFGYVATASLFPNNIPVFEHALDTLIVTDPDLAPSPNDGEALLDGRGASNGL